MSIPNKDLSFHTSLGTTAQATRASLSLTRSTDSVYTSGPTEEGLKVSGKNPECTGPEPLAGVMAECN